MLRSVKRFATKTLRTRRFHQDDLNLCETLVFFVSYAEGIPSGVAKLFIFGKKNRSRRLRNGTVNISGALKACRLTGFTRGSYVRFQNKITSLSQGNNIAPKIPLTKFPVQRELHLQSITSKNKSQMYFSQSATSLPPHAVQPLFTSLV